MAVWELERWSINVQLLSKLRSGMLIGLLILYDQQTEFTIEKCFKPINIYENGV